MNGINICKYDTLFNYNQTHFKSQKICYKFIHYYYFLYWFYYDLFSNFSCIKSLKFYSVVTFNKKLLIMWDSKNKFYVIWKWKNIWIFNSWEECKKNVIWFSDAKYKSFSHKKDAEIALKEWWEKYYKDKDKKHSVINDFDIPYFSNGIAVDAACSGNPWEMEYRWIELKTWIEIFHESFMIWTNNIWEFLAIVHWLKYLWNDNRVVYSDSKIAISRVNQWKCKTLLNSKKNLKYDFSELFIAIESAESRIKENGIKHNILKWDTEKRWEIPADFWRK